LKIGISFEKESIIFNSSSENPVVAITIGTFLFLA